MNDTYIIWETDEAWRIRPTATPRIIGAVCYNDAAIAWSWAYSAEKLWCVVAKADASLIKRITVVRKVTYETTTHLVP
jgi:hypothetical protein